MSDFTVDDRTERLVPRTTAPRNARGVATVGRTARPAGRRVGHGDGRRERG